MPPLWSSAASNATARTVRGVALGALALALLWWLSDVVLLAFAGLLLGLVLDRLARPLRPRLHRRSALAVVVLTLVCVLVIGAWLAGASIAAELEQLQQTLPRAWTQLREWLSSHAPGRWMLAALAQTQELPQGWAERAAAAAARALNGTLSALGTIVLLVALGIYFAADPDTYRDGALRLVTRRRRARVEATLDAVAGNLVRWLKGQGVSMVVVGVLTAIGLAVLGLPLVLTLSVLTAVLEFVPYFGSIAASVIIIAVAFSEGEGQALWAALMCLVVQQAEAIIVQPAVQRWAVRMPPALSLLAVLVFGLLFGLPGVVLAVPLMVVAMTLVQQWRDGRD